MFADKNYLLLLFLIPLIIIFFIVALKKRKQSLSRFISAANLPVLSNVNFAAYGIRSFFLVLGFTFLILALSRPQLGEKETEVKIESAEIVIALDVSKSMLAEDVKPNRLEKSKLLLMNIAQECKGDKIGALVFSGAAMWQCPMTYDADALKMFVQDVNVGVMPVGGTQFSAPIELALRTVSGNPAKTKVMVLISDGEDHDEKTSYSVKAAQAAGLKIVCVGIGTYEGALIPEKNEAGITVKYVKDSSGKMVTSRLNSDLMKKISGETGGKYFEITDKTDMTENILKEIKTLEKTPGIKKNESNKKERFQIFLFAAFVCLLFGFVYPNSFKVKK